MKYAAIVLVFITTCQHTGRETQSETVTQTSDDHLLRKLRIARRDVLKELVNAVQQRLAVDEMIGIERLEALSTFRRSLCEAELELTTAKKERLAILEEGHKAACVCEERLNLFENGVSLDAQFLAKSDRLQYEIEIQLEKNTP